MDSSDGIGRPIKRGTMEFFVGGWTMESTTFQWIPSLLWKLPNVPQRNYLFLLFMFLGKPIQVKQRKHNKQRKKKEGRRGKPLKKRKWRWQVSTKEFFHPLQLSLILQKERYSLHHLSHYLPFGKVAFDCVFILQLEKLLVLLFFKIVDRLCYGFIDINLHIM